MRHRTVAVAAAALLLSVVIASAERPALDTPLPVDPEVTIGKLPNGLSYYVRRNGTPAGRAELRLAVNAGSVLESDSQRGLAHFVEHMAFNGTESFGKSEIVDYLESIGMRFGPEINAYTSFDETVYEIEVPTDDPAILEKAVRILSEWAFRVSFEPEEVDKERGVIVEEWRLGRGADGRIRDRQLPVLLSGSRYAERLPIGDPEIIRTAPRAEIERFYRDWYRPDLMAVIAVGDFDPAWVEGLVRRAFSGFRGPERPRERTAFNVPDHPETLYSVVTDPEATMSVVSVYAGRDVGPFLTVGDYRERIVASLAVTMLSSRLDELAQKPEPPFIQAYADMDRLVRSREAFALVALTPPGGMERGLEALLTELERVRVHGFSAGELERAASDFMRGMERYHRERDKSTSRQFAEEYVRAFLTGEPIPGIAYEYRLHAEFVPGIGLDEVNELAGSLLGDSSRVVLAQAPASGQSRVPAEADLQAVFDRVRAASVASWVDTAVEGPLVVEPPRGSPVVAVQALEPLGAERWILANGVTVILKPTTFRNDELLVTAFSPGGSSLVADRDYIAAATATSVVAEAGLDGWSATDLQKKLAGTAVRVRSWIAELHEGLDGSTSPRELETLLELVYLQFTSPRRDEAAYRSFKERYQASVSSRRSSPEVLFGDALRAIMSGSSARSRPVTPEVLEEMDLERSLTIYRDRFGDAGDFTFVFVGSMDLASVRPLVERWLGGLPSSGRRERWRDLGVDPPLETAEAEVRAGIEPRSRVAIRFAGEFPYSRDEIVALTAAADILEVRLREKLREELGGTYGASVAASAQKYPDQEYQVSIDFGCDPARVEELTRAVFREIAAMRDGTLEPQELATVKETLRRSREEALGENSFWLSAIRASLMNEEDPAEMLAFPKRVEALDEQAVMRAARSYFTPARYVRVVLAPVRKP